MPQSSYNKLLQEWIKKWKDENLSLETQKLISQANFDLYYGPDTCGDEEESYPGFTTACKMITEALYMAELPSEIYIDTDSGEVLETEPSVEKCESCDGNGRTIEDEDEICLDCHGLGSLEPSGDWWYVDQNEMRSALLGKELSPYIRN
jgi:hypothetical protein